MTTRRRDAARLHVTIVGTPATRAARRGLGPWLCAVAPRRARGEVTIALVSDARMRVLNRTFRGVDHGTDVLSFRSDSIGPTVAPPSLGDVAIATGVAARQARTAGHTLGTELRVLALHGLLHLLGFDHDTDRGQMARTEAKLRRAGRLPEGLIERAQPARRAARSAAAPRPRR